MIRAFPESCLVAYSGKGKIAAFTAAANQQIAILNVRAFNNSGGAINVGLLRLLTTPSIKLWTFITSGSVFADVTAAVVAGTATNILTTTNNDGYYVQSKRKFGMVGLTVSSAGGGSPVYTYKYYNGSTFTTLTTLEVPSYGSTGDKWVVFQPPSDWALGGNASLDSSEYAIQVIATTANSSAVAVTATWVAEFLELYEAVPNNACIQLSFPDSKPLTLNGGEGLIPYFATAAAANQFGAYYIAHT